MELALSEVANAVVEAGWGKDEVAAVWSMSPTITCSGWVRSLELTR
jgi:hypothetical protein